MQNSSSGSGVPASLEGRSGLGRAPVGDLPRGAARAHDHATHWSAARPTAVPIVQTATFAQSSATGFDAYDYSRSGNPTRAVLEAELARLEHGARGFALSSGMAAIAAVLSGLGAGDVLLVGDDLYGGTVRYAERVLAPRGVRVEVVRPLGDAGRGASEVEARSAPDEVAARSAAWAHALARWDSHRHASGRVFAFLEVPTNPRLCITDLARVAALTRAQGATLVVDNTALSPHWLNPLRLGADVVVHSGTKHLGGHGDVTAGAVVTAASARGAEVAEHAAFVQNAEGTALAPFECWLLLRGMKTLGVRLDREGEGALAVARWLAARPDVDAVLHPGLATHPGHAVLRALVNDPERGFGTLVSFTTGDAERSRRLVEELGRLGRFTIAVSFGNVASSVSLPCFMSHASVPDAAARPPRDLVRLSIGLEPVPELCADLARALESA